ncbi:hypothetical protein ACE3MQ_21085 [Paenibacillus lentus]|uniref:hypothetical protein n=1 Tax=Paenibacillus lentus TaxID=1338368 RepID=UPI0036669111
MGSYLHGVTYGNGTFVAVGDSGTIIQSGPAPAPTPTPAVAPSQPGNTSVDVLINGKAVNAGATATERNGQTVTIVTFDQSKLENMLATEGQHSIVTIRVNTKSDVVVEWSGQTVKNMENNQAVIEIITDRANVYFASPTADKVQIVESAASKGAFTMVVLKKSKEMSLT